MYMCNVSKAVMHAGMRLILFKGLAADILTNRFYCWILNTYETAAYKKVLSSIYPHDMCGFLTY